MATPPSKVPSRGRPPSKVPERTVWGGVAGWGESRGAALAVVVQKLQLIVLILVELHGAPAAALPLGTCGSSPSRPSSAPPRRGAARKHSRPPSSVDASKREPNRSQCERVDRVAVFRTGGQWSVSRSARVALLLSLRCPRLAAGRSYHVGTARSVGCSEPEATVCRLRPQRASADE